ncbi:MerR family transcriptional regulator [Streptomyces niveiscabiei]|uniref:MerR family transcriptional regulator n=1 Tax=Streptomyces niveiscabiei TaxID=164115 RepID=UPI0029A3F18D|nr:MerR family transcriptional regulator [Streptomyces niveiscabiei]MDX3386592.1 MerR family transcriptional regulator [Streptomyces niveiscabiei]
MRIGDAAAAVGATPRALRFYEQRGLLPPPHRTPSGQRDYTATDLAVLRVVRELLALGLTVEDLHTIADRLPLLATTSQRSCDPTARKPGAAGANVIDRRIAALDADIARLTRLRDGLREAAGRPVPEG